MKRFLWAGYRIIRGCIFRIAGRDPLGGPVSLRDEFHAARILTTQSRPSPVRDDGSFRLWSTSLGEFWAPLKADAHFMLMLQTEAALNVYRFGKHKTVIDCGANIGFATRQALSNGAEIVIAFEPCPENAECYSRNFAQEILSGRVVLCRKGAWSGISRVFLGVSEAANPGSPSIRPADKSEVVEVEKDKGGNSGLWIDTTTIDAVVEGQALSSVDFIKMDIEGAEVEALLGASETIRRSRPFIGLGTEHTSDIYDNNVSVIRTIRSIEPAYQYLVTESHPFKSAGRGWVMAPHSIYFWVPEAASPGAVMASPQPSSRAKSVS
jgi:FkbM family methyltransferase